MGDLKTTRELLLNMEKCECCKEAQEAFKQYMAQHDKEEQIRLLTEQRDELLQSIHRDEKRISCVDYLIYEIQTGKIKSGQ